MAIRVKPDSITPRATPPVEVPDSPLPVADKYHLVALNRIHREIAAMSRKLASEVRLVDEYSIVGGYTGVGELIVEVQPQFDTMNELIQSVIVTGPASTAFTLQLGDRNWSVLTDASGRLEFTNIGLLLGRNDRRLLTSAMAGNWTLELMGRADERY